MRRVVRAASPELLCSGESSYRELDDVYLQTQTKIWLGEVLHMRIDEETAIANLLADGELLFQVSKVVWKMLLEKRVDLKHSKIHIYERTSSGKSDGRYMPYPKVDSFLKVCQILGLTGIDLFSPSDVVEKRDVRRVCMCIRSLSKKSRLQNLDVPDFDKVTYTIAMPTDLVGGIRRNLEQSQSTSSSSNGYIQSMDSRELYRQRGICGDHARYYDSFSESDEVESAFMEPELDSPLSNFAYDATYLSRVVRDKSSDGNLVFDGHLSALQSEFRLERWDGDKEGCNGLPAVLNDFCHSRAVKNNNGKLQEVDYNKSSYPEQRNNQAVSTYFGDTGFVMWPNLDSQSLIKGSFQSSALPFEDSPFNMDELAVSAEDDNGTMLRSKHLNYSVSQCTPFDSYRNPDCASGEFMKAFKAHSSSSEEASYNTGDNDSVTSECSVTTEEVSGKGCAYITKVHNKMSNLSNNTGSLGMVRDNISIKVRTMHTEGNKNNGNSSFAADTDSKDWISASEIESKFLFDLGLLQTMFDTQELHSCVKTKILKSVGSFSSTASEKQITPGIVDDLQIDRDGDCVPKVDLDIMDGPFNSETTHIKSDCLSCMTAPGFCDRNEGKCAFLHNICPSHTTVMPVKDVSVTALEVDADELVNVSIVETECGVVLPVDLTSNDLSVGESKSHNRISQSGALTRYNMDVVANQFVSVDCDSEIIGCRESNPTMASETYAPRILQQINASDDTDLLTGNHYAEKNVSATLENDHVTETCGSETQEKTTSVDLSEICSQAPNVHEGTRSIVPGSGLDAPNHSVREPAYGSHLVGKSHAEVILPRSKPAYMAGKDTSAHKIVELEIPALPGVNDVRSGIEHKEAEEIDGGVKGVNADMEFETQSPVGCSSTGDKEGDTSKPHPPVKKVLKSIAGGITLFGALFLLLHIKGKRDQEKNSRMLTPLQNRNSRSEHVEKGDSAKLYPADRLKF